MRLAALSIQTGLRGSLRSASLLCVLAGLALWIIPVGVHAQQTAINETGFKAYGSYQAGAIDNINMVNLKPTIAIPLLEYPQLGSLHFSFNIVYHPIMFYPDSSCGEGKPTPSTCSATFLHTGGDVTIEPSFVYRADDCDENMICGITQGQGVAVHELRPLAPLSAREWRSADATGIRRSANTIVDANGIVYDLLMPFGEGVMGSLTNAVTDPNGNTITATFDSTATSYPKPITGWTDSVGRYVPYPFTLTSSTQDFTGCTGQLPTIGALLWDVPGIGTGSGTVRYKICFAKISVNGPFPKCSASNCNVDNSPFLTIQSLVLPNGQAWTFNYNIAGGYADLSSIIFPTGGTLSYTWATYIHCSHPPFLGWQSFTRAIQTRTLNAQDGSGPHQWQYQQTYSASAPEVTTTVTDPDNNVTVHKLSHLGAQCSVYETELDKYQGSSTLLQSISTGYNYTIDPAAVSSGVTTAFTSIYNVVPTSIMTTYPAGQGSQVSQVTTSYDSGIPDAYGSSLLYGQPIARQEYDFGSGAPGFLLRQTNYFYKWQENGSYKSANLINLPCLVTTYGAGSVSQPTSCTASSTPSNQIAQASYSYDENNGSPQGALGNRTSFTRWLNGGSSPKTQTIYNSQGMPTKEIDPNGNSTVITYDSTGLFPKQIQQPTTNGVQHIERFRYDGNTGLMLSHTDQNDQITSYEYDSMRRLAHVSYPDGGSESYAYDDTPPSPSFTYTRALNASQNLTQVGIVDGLGRKKQTQITSDPAGIDYVDTTYDNLGRVLTVSNPYRNKTTEDTYGVTTYTYDALNRKITLKNPDGSSRQWCYNDLGTASQTICAAHLGSISNGIWVDSGDETGRHWQQTSDALGRLSDVIEDASNAKFETDYQYDGLDNLIYVNQKGDGSGSRTRSFIYDSLSRLSSSKNPEAGAIAYTYDANGNIKMKTDARGIETDYSYDALNRLISKSYQKDPFKAPAQFYIYDIYQTSNICSGCSDPTVFFSSSSIGRMTENYTADNKTRNVYAYDPLGRVLAKASCFSASGDCASGAAFGPPVEYTYDLAGNMQSSTNGISGPDIHITYGYDSSSHLSSIMTNWSGDALYPDTLFQAKRTSSPPSYDPFGNLSYGEFGTNNGSAPQFSLTQTFDSRGRLDTKIYSTPQ